MSRSLQWGLMAVLAAIHGVVWWRAGSAQAGLFASAIGVAAVGRVLWLHHARHQPQPSVGLMWIGVSAFVFQAVLTLWI